jgi:hypothetical protein
LLLYLKKSARSDLGLACRAAGIVPLHLRTEPSLLITNSYNHIDYL